VLLGGLSHALRFAACANCRGGLEQHFLEGVTSTGTSPAASALQRHTVETVMAGRSVQIAVPRRSISRRRLMTSSTAL
jgi:hypothetical protein